MSYHDRLSLTRRLPNIKADWLRQHVRAVRDVTSGVAAFTPSPEVAIVQALSGWLMYADAHRARFETGIGDDLVLGDSWARWGMNLRELLNGETGRLDCGTLDSLIHGVLLDEDWNPDTGQRLRLSERQPPVYRTGDGKLVTVPPPEREDGEGTPW